MPWTSCCSLGCSLRYYKGPPPVLSCFISILLLADLGLWGKSQYSANGSGSEIYTHWHPMTAFGPFFWGGSICHLHPRLCARADVNHASEASKSWVYPEFWGNFSHRYHQSRFCIHILISSKGHPIMMGCQWWQWSLYIHHFLTMARFYWWSLLDPVVCSCWSKNMTPPEQINRNGGKHTIHAPHGLGIWVLGCPRIGYQKSRLHHHTYI